MGFFLFAGVLAMSALSKWEKGETTGTFISSKVNGNWTKSNIRPISSKVNQSQQTGKVNFDENSDNNLFTQVRFFLS